MSDAPKIPDQFLVTDPLQQWPHGNAVVAEVLERCHQSEALRVIDELIEHARTMGIASRFKQDRYANQLLTSHEADPPLELLDYIFGRGKKLSEVGHKRACLLTELVRIRNALQTVFSRIAFSRLDIEVTNMEGDGTHVPKPSVEALESANIFKRS